jgi:hypothetical protein
VPPTTPDAEWDELERRLEEGQLRQQAERKLADAKLERLGAAKRLKESRSEFPERESPTASQRQGRLLIDLADKRAKEADLQRVVDGYARAESDLARLRPPSVETAPVQTQSWRARARSAVDVKLVVAVIAALGGSAGISTLLKSCHPEPTVTQMQWEQHLEEWSRWKTFMRGYYRCDIAFTEISGSAHRAGLQGGKIMRGVDQNSVEWYSQKLATGDQQVWTSSKEVPQDCPVPPAD